MCSVRVFVGHDNELLVVNKKYSSQKPVSERLIKPKNKSLTFLISKVAAVVFVPVT